MGKIKKKDISEIVWDLLKDWKKHVVYQECERLDDEGNFLILKALDLKNKNPYFIVYALEKEDFVYKNKFNSFEKAKIYIEYLQCISDFAIKKNYSFLKFFEENEHRIPPEDYLDSNLDIFIKEHGYFYEKESWEFLIKKIDWEYWIIVAFCQDEDEVKKKKIKLQIAFGILKDCYNNKLKNYLDIKKNSKEGKIELSEQRELLSRLGYVLGYDGSLKVKWTNKEILRTPDYTYTIVQWFWKLINFK